MGLLTDEEMAAAQGDKERCMAVINGFGNCKGCSAYCHEIAKAQVAKIVRQGKENCQHHDTELLRRECDECWEQLEKESK